MVQKVRRFDKFLWHGVWGKDMNDNKTQNIVDNRLEIHHIDVEG